MLLHSKKTHLIYNYEVTNHQKNYRKGIFTNRNKLKLAVCSNELISGKPKRVNIFLIAYIAPF